MLLSKRSRNDARLVTQVRRGQTRRFADLVDRYRNLVYATVLARIGDPDDADDVAQETFVSAYRQLDQLADARKFGPWLRQIAHNQAANFVRAERIRERYEEEQQQAAAPPDQQVEDDQDHARMWAAIQQLPQDQREALLLYYMEDHSIGEVARFLQTSKGAVRGRLQRARQRLRDSFEQELRDTVGSRRRGKGFTEKVMAGLPLLVWNADAAPLRFLGWRPMVCGLGLGAAALIGGMIGRLEPWEWLTGVEDDEAPAVHVHVLDAAGRSRVIDQLHFADDEPASLYNTSRITPQGREAERQALRQGTGGKLRWEFAGLGGWVVRQQYRAGSVPVHRDLTPHATERGLRFRVLTPGRRTGTTRVELVSPELGYDSELFDQLRIRIRLGGIEPEPEAESHTPVAHGAPSKAAPGGGQGGRWRRSSTGPVEADLAVAWTNPLNRFLPGRDPRGYRLVDGEWSTADHPWYPRNRFARCTPLKLRATPEWQVLTADSLGQRGMECWVGELVDVRLTLRLDWSGPMPAGGWSGEPELEIDWVELSRGRGAPSALPLPARRDREVGGGLLRAGPLTPLDARYVALLNWPLMADVDGDGDLDVVVGATYESDLWDRRLATAFHSYARYAYGWITALNDGRGHFRQGESRVLPLTRGMLRGIVRLHGAHLDGDARMDLVVAHGQDTRAYRRGAVGEWRELVHRRDQLCLGSGDLDGDGRAEIISRTYRGGPLHRVTAHALAADGRVARRPVCAVADPYTPSAFTDLDGDGRFELVACSARAASWLILTDWRRGAFGGRQVLDAAHAAAFAGYAVNRWPAYVGDSNRDGRWEIGVAQVPLREGFYGLAAGLRVLAGPGAVDRWLPRQVHLDPVSAMRPSVVPQVHDLDQDGTTDLVFLDRNGRTGPALLVLRSKGEGHTTERYRIDGTPQGWCAGDLDGDGDVDIAVVVDDVGKRGVQVWWNTGRCAAGHADTVCQAAGG